MPFTINLDHDTFEAGTVISGAIFISNENSISAKELRITFKGEERVRVVDKESKRSFDDEFLFHQYSEELQGVIKGGKIKSGKFIVPFKIQIPDLLPQTITIPWTHVSYLVGCELEDRKGRTFEQATSSVNILAKPIQHEAIPCHREPFTEYIKKNRFLAGHFVIALEISDTTVEPGEEVGVSLAIRNRSPVQIVTAKAVLRQEACARVDGHERKAERILSFHEFKVYRKAKRHKSKWLRGTDPEDDFEEVEAELTYEEHRGTLRVPKNATLTYAGKLFDVKQDLFVHIQTTLQDPIEIHITPMIVERKVVPIDPDLSDASSEYEYPTLDTDVEHIK